MEKSSPFSLLLDFLSALLKPKAGPEAVVIPDIEYLSASQMSKIEGNKVIYQWASEKVSKGIIPWEALATIHYRESSFNRTSPIPGGPFQLDPGGHGDELRTKIDEYTDKICRIYSVSFASIETDFYIASLVAMHEFKQKVKGIIRKPDGSVDRDVLADAFWGYNGRANFHTPDGKSNNSTKHWRYSSYVSNDPQRGNQLRIRGTMPSADGKTRVKIDRDDKQIGAIIIYDEICKRFNRV